MQKAFPLSLMAGKIHAFPAWTWKSFPSLLIALQNGLLPQNRFLAV